MLFRNPATPAPVCEVSWRITCSGVPVADQRAAGVAALGAEVDDPVGGADHVEVVLDHHQRVPGGEQPAERLEQLGDVVEMQAGGRLVEQEQAYSSLAPLSLLPGGPQASGAAPRRRRASAPAGRAAGIPGRRRRAARGAPRLRARRRRTRAPRIPSSRARPRCSCRAAPPRAPRGGSACRRSPGSAGRRPTGTASRRARSRCRRRSGSGRCRR